MLEIKGSQFGVRIEPRGSYEFPHTEGDPHVCIQLLGEDDEAWFKIGERFSAYWLHDLIDTLMMTEKFLNNTDTIEPSPDGYGWRFKEES